MSSCHDSICSMSVSIEPAGESFAKVARSCTTSFISEISASDACKSFEFEDAAMMDTMSAMKANRADAPVHSKMNLDNVKSGKEHMASFLTGKEHFHSQTQSLHYLGSERFGVHQLDPSLSKFKVAGRAQHGNLMRSFKKK